MPATTRTVTENLEALPHIIRSAAAFIHGKPYRVGPSSIGARDNPYGAAATPNPTNGRVALADMDPRQRGLLGAAWYLGYVAHMARGARRCGLPRRRRSASSASSTPGWTMRSPGSTSRATASIRSTT